MYSIRYRRNDGKEECRNEGSLICETDLRKVQGDQEKRQNHDYLREPEAQTETGLRKHRPLLSGDYARWEEAGSGSRKKDETAFSTFSEGVDNIR